MTVKLVRALLAPWPGAIVSILAVVWTATPPAIAHDLAHGSTVSRSSPLPSWLHPVNRLLPLPDSRGTWLVDKGLHRITGFYPTRRDRPSAIASADMQTASIVARVTLPGRLNPTAIASDLSTNEILVGALGGARPVKPSKEGGYRAYLVALDRRSLRVRHVLLLGTAGPWVPIIPDAVAAAFQLHMAYVATLLHRTYVVDLRTWRVVNVLPMGQGAEHIVVDEATNRVFLSDGSRLAMLNAQTGRLIRSFAPMLATALALDAANRLVFVNSISEIFALSAADGAVLYRMSPPGYAATMVLSPGLGRLIVAVVGTTPGIVAVDERTGRVVAHFNHAVEPRADLAVDPGAQRVFVLFTGTNELAVLRSGSLQTEVLVRLHGTEIGDSGVVLDTSIHRGIVLSSQFWCLESNW